MKNITAAIFILILAVGLQSCTSTVPYSNNGNQYGKVKRLPPGKAKKIYGGEAKDYAPGKYKKKGKKGKKRR